MHILEFHLKSRSHFGLLSSPYLLVQRLNVLELIMNYLRWSYDIQTKISFHVQESSMTGMHPVLTTIIIILMILGNHGVLQSSFRIDLELAVLDL